MLEQQRRWRLLLGAENTQNLSQQDIEFDNLLNFLYSDDRQAGLGGSNLKVSKWLGDIRNKFPKSVIKVLQKDAFERLNMEQMLLEPEMLEDIEADIDMVANLISLQHLIPNKSRETARSLVKKLVDDLLQKLKSETEQAVKGALNKAMKTKRPLKSDIDWGRTIRANLKNYQADYKTIIPERIIGYGRKKPHNLKRIMLCVDQSGSMAPSVIYASIFAAVLSSIPALKTDLIVFDTTVVDLTEQLADPVEVIFGIQLGGGTDINRAIAYCADKIEKPKDTNFILITDLYEGGDSKQLIKRVGKLKELGVNIITLLALDDDGTPSYDHTLATSFANLDIPTFACTPDLFPDLMSTALNDGDIDVWASKNNIVLEQK